MSYSAVGPHVELAHDWKGLERRLVEMRIRISEMKMAGVGARARGRDKGVKGQGARGRGKGSADARCKSSLGLYEPIDMQAIQALQRAASIMRSPKLEI